MSMGAPSMDVLVSLSKRRGFVFQSSEIYGGTGSCWDYGPLGVELKNNIKRVWWRDFVQRRADMVGIDASIQFPRRPRRRVAVDPLLPGHQGQQVHDPSRRAVWPLRPAAHAVSRVRQG